MKKYFSIMLCLGIAIPVFAATPTSVDLAKKAKSIGEKRSLITQALADPQLNQQAETYFVAGDIELKAFDDGYKIKLINPDDPSAQGPVLGDALVAAYNYFMKALPLDSVPNEKGQIKPKYSKEIMNKLTGHANDFFGAGADYYNSQMFYPQAYDAFMIYGNLPNILTTNTNFDPQQIATAFFNAGLAANQGGNIDASADAFKKARLNGYDKPEATIYEIACWQTIAQQDESRVSEAQNKIKDAAQFGISTFGIEDPIFINNYINSLVNNGDIDESISMLNDYIDKNPENANLYGLRGYVYDIAGKEDLSEADYRKASSLPTVDFETLLNTGKKLYRVGVNKLNELEGNSPETNSARQDIKQNYFLEAQSIAEKANKMKPGDSGVQNLLDSIDYVLTTNY